MQGLLELVEEGAIAEFAMSFLVPGCMLSGLVISGRRFYQLTADSAGGELGPLIAQLGRTMYPSESEQEVSDRRPVEQPGAAVHLTGVMTFWGRPPVPVNGQLRLKRNAILGYGFGRIGLVEP